MCLAVGGWAIGWGTNNLLDDRLIGWSGLLFGFLLLPLGFVTLLLSFFLVCWLTAFACAA